MSNITRGIQENSTPGSIRSRDDDDEFKGMHHTQIKKLYETKMWELTKKLNKVQKELEKREDDVELLTKKLLKYDEAQVGMANQIATNFLKRQNQNEEIIRRITGALVGQKKELSEEVDMLMDELEKYKKMAKDEGSVIEELRGIIVDQRADLAELRLELAQLKKSKGEKDIEHSKSVKMIENLQGRIEAEEKSYTKSVRSLASNFEDKFNHEMMARVKDLHIRHQKEKESYEEEIGQLQERISELEEEKKALIEDKETLGMIVKDLEADVREKAEKNKKLDTSMRLNQTISESLEDAKREIDYWKDQCDIIEKKYKKEFHKLQTTFKNKLDQELALRAQEFRETVSRQNKATNSAIERLEGEKSELYSQVSAKDDLIAQLKARIEDLENDVDFRNKKISLLKTDMKDINEEQKDYQKIVHENKRLKEKLAELEVEKKAFIQHIKLLESQIGYLEKKQTYVVAENETLRAHSPIRSAKKA